MTLWNELDQSQSRKIANEWQSLFDKGSNPFLNYSDCINLNRNYKKMRNGLIDVFRKTPFTGKYGYEFDAEFGLKLYSYLNNEFNMTESDASNDNYWRYIQMMIVPDIMFERWPLDKGKFRHSRFWEESQRLYLKSEWWYIHIIWAGSEDKTRRYLTNIDISQLIDRSGRNGTRVAVYKEIMHVFGTLQAEQRKPGLISRILIYNASYCSSLEPELMSCSLSEYVNRLYLELGVDV